MLETEGSTVLVTPVWNDSARLAVFGPRLALALRESCLPVRWIVADDGSGSEEKSRVKQLVAIFRESYPSVEAMFFAERSFKGGAIYAAWDACPEATWVGFVDADGAIDEGSTLALIRRAMAKGSNSGCVGIRQDSPNTPVHRPLGRRLSFYAFARLVRLFVGIRFQDTQCGAKVVPGAGYRAVADKLKERGYVFDVELLLALGRYGCNIEELPIPWREIPGGKVHPLRDAWRMVAGLSRIRKRLNAGVYDT